MDNNELQHHGILGMKWGVRRYQNKDGSLTKAGKKRYDSELEKIRAEEKVLKNKKSTKSKIDRLNARKQKLEDSKKEFEDKLKADKAKAKGDDVTTGKSASKAKDNEVSLAAKRQKILDSHDAETIYKNKDILSDTEVQAALARLRNEKDIKALIPEKVSKGKKFVEDLDKMGKTASSLTKSASEILNNVSNIKKLIKKFTGDDNDDDSGGSNPPKEKKQKEPKEKKQKESNEPKEPKEPKKKEPVIYEAEWEDISDSTQSSSFVTSLVTTRPYSNFTSSSNTSSGQSFIAGFLEEHR